jgi:hypothetical protein
MNPSIYQSHIDHPGWSHLPALSRVILGRRKELKLSIKEVSASIFIKGLSGDDVAKRIQIFETGGLIRRDLFNEVVIALELDSEEVDHLIEHQRLNDLRAAEGWTHEARGLELTICLSASKGFTQGLPNNVKTPAEAEVFAAETAKERGVPVILSVRNRVRLWFGPEGTLSKVETVPGRWSHSPFAGTLGHPPDANPDGDPDRREIRKAVKEMGRALARARGLDPDGWRFGLPAWYGQLPPTLAVLFRKADFWREVAKREGTTLDLLHTDLAES